MKSTIELTDLELPVDLGTYGPDDVVPENHLLDLTLTIDPRWVLVSEDAMSEIFDYDPLIADIDQLARDGHYETQERLMTRIVEACTPFEAIQAVTLRVKKRPVLRGSGTLGVRLEVDAEGMQKLRGTHRPASLGRRPGALASD